MPELDTCPFCRKAVEYTDPQWFTHPHDEECILSGWSWTVENAAKWNTRQAAS
jgi:hypothetical protein